MVLSAMLFAVITQAKPAEASKETKKLTCGLYEIEVTDDYSLKVNGKDAGAYKGTIMDKYFSYQHRYQKDDQVSEVRETQKGRMAFRIIGESRWNACIEQPEIGTGK